jgi:hypothetical protein
MIDSCVNITPFGLPVVPEVYINEAISPGDGENELLLPLYRLNISGSFSKETWRWWDLHYKIKRWPSAFR